MAEVRRPDGDQATVPAVTFADVAGLDEAVEELAEIKEYLLDPDRFRALGATLPKGMLLVGPPGTGKTLLTRALAGEAGIPFQVVSAAGLVEVYVGVGPARVRQVFAQARKQAPSIVFIDELDAIGRSRALNAAGGQEERESTLNQLGSGEIGAEMAAEIRRLVTEAHETATRVLFEHRTLLDRLAGQLIRYETLEKPEIDRLLAGVGQRARRVAA